VRLKASKARLICRTEPNYIHQRRSNTTTYNLRRSV